MATRSGRGPTPGAVGLVILLAALVLVAMGYQQGQFQRQYADITDQLAAQQEAAETREVCYRRWGRELVRTTEARVGANSRKERASDAERTANGNVLLTVIALRTIPPEATPRDFDRTLLAYAEARARLDRVTSQVVETRRDNPYPKLRCG